MKKSRKTEAKNASQLHGSFFIKTLFSDFQVIAVTIVCFIATTGCRQGAPDFFPLGNELVLEYSIRQSINNKENEPKLIIANLPEKKIDDVSYYPRRTASGNTDYFRITPEGVVHSNNRVLSDAIVLKYPLAEGVTWRSGSNIEILERRHESFAGGESFISLGETIRLDYMIKSLNEPVNVPAGEFSGCMRIETSGSARVNARTRGIDNVVIEQIEWYVPDIGLVKRIRKEFTVPDKISGELIQELISIRHG